MAKSLDKMDKDELREELKARKDAVREVERAIDQYDDRKTQQIRAEMEALAAKAGYKIDEIFGGSKSKGKARAKGAPRYRHPENGSITWTGKGRQPVWYKKHVEAGRDPSELAI